MIKFDVPDDKASDLLDILSKDDLKKLRAGVQSLCDRKREIEFLKNKPVRRKADREIEFKGMKHE